MTKNKIFHQGPRVEPVNVNDKIGTAIFLSQKVPFRRNDIKLDTSILCVFPTAFRYI